MEVRKNAGAMPSQFHAEKQGALKTVPDNSNDLAGRPGLDPTAGRKPLKKPLKPVVCG
jgi:hypothetical protein